MKALVTGASGWIGSRLVSRLTKDGWDVTALVRPEGARRGIPGGAAAATVIPADFLSAAAVRAAVLRCEPEALFHCAMPSGHPSNAAGRLEALAVAVNGTAHLAEAAAEAGVRRFVHLGSFLGYRPQDRPIREDDPIDPATPRGAAKAAASIWLRQFAKAQAFPAVELRIFSVYGPGEPEYRFIPTLLRAARDGSPIHLLQGAARDLVYVDDVVDACLAAIDATCNPGAVFNVGTGEATANEQVVRIVESITGTAIRIAGEYPAKPADGVWRADISLAREVLKWQPRRTLLEGLKEALQSLT